MSDLARHLAAYDGRNISALSEAQAAYRTDPQNDPGYWDDLVTLAGAPEPLLSDGATRILSDELKSGATLGPERTARLVGMLDALSSWQAMLHLCQSLEHAALSAPQRATVAQWAAGLLDHSRPFLRAWSLHLYVKTCADTGAARSALDAAEQDPAASVRARARNLRKLPDLSR